MELATLHFLGLFGYCCPCLLAWKNAEALGENPLLHCVGTFFFPIVTLQRYRTRQKFGIDVSINIFFLEKNVRICYCLEHVIDPQILREINFGESKTYAHKNQNSEPLNMLEWQMLRD